AVANERGNVPTRLTQRLAHVTALEPRELVLPFGDQCGPPRQDPPTLCRRRPGPPPLERPPRRGDRFVHVLRRPAGQRTERLARARVHDQDGFPSGCFAPGTVDQDGPTGAHVPSCAAQNSAGSRTITGAGCISLPLTRSRVAASGREAPRARCGSAPAPDSCCDG